MLIYKSICNQYQYEFIRFPNPELHQMEENTILSEDSDIIYTSTNLISNQNSVKSMINDMASTDFT